MALGAQQQPLNCPGFCRIGLYDDLADDFRTIVDFPGRLGEVCADLPTLCLSKRLASGALKDQSKPPSLASQV